MRPGPIVSREWIGVGPLVVRVSAEAIGGSSWDLVDLRDGAVQGLVGQRPVDMGSHAVMALDRLRQRLPIPQ